MKCKICKAEAAVALRSHNTAFCEQCFLDFFRRQLERAIKKQNLFTRDERILVAISGGKDSLALMLELQELGYKVSGLFIDLAIPAASTMARHKVDQFCNKHDLNLQIINMADEGLAIPDVRAKTQQPICSVCGRIKRYYFNKAAMAGNYDVLATGHNLDDEVARLLSNTLRWDYDYLASQSPSLPAENGFVRKVKPLWRLTEFETANYAYLQNIEHHCAPCPYSQGASFSALKGWMQSLESKMPGRKLDFYTGFLERGRQAFARQQAAEKFHACQSCGYPTTGDDLCGICRLREKMRS